MMMQLIDRKEIEPMLTELLEPLIQKLLATVEIKRVEPLLIDVGTAATMLSRSKRFVIDALSRNLIAGKKSDGRTLIVVQSLRDYVNALEPARGTPNRRRPQTLKMDQQIIASRAKQERARAKAA
jgi:hypothetical protein